MEGFNKLENKHCNYHSWEYRELDTANEYLVCSKCGMLPGGHYEESD